MSSESRSRSFDDIQYFSFPPYYEQRITFVKVLNVTIEGILHTGEKAKIKMDAEQIVDSAQVRLAKMFWQDENRRFIFDGECTGCVFAIEKKRDDE